MRARTRARKPLPHGDGEEGRSEGRSEGLVAPEGMETATGEPDAATAEATEMSAAEGGASEASEEEP